MPLGVIKRVLAIIVDYGGAKDAERLSCQLAQTAHRGFELTVIHVDNGNEKPTELSVRQRELGVRLLRLADNGGYASALNAAVQKEEEQGRDYGAYWFLNPDLLVSPDALGRLVTVLNSHPRVGAVGPEVRLGQSEKVWGARGVVSPWTGLTRMTEWKQGGELPRWSYIPGCSLLARAEAYRDVGGMPERYMLYYEEAHFCVQLQKRAWKLWVDPDAVVFHMVHSLDKGVPARHFAFYFARNNLYFWKTNFGIPAWLQLPRTLAVSLKELVLPLRRARSLPLIWDRLKYIGAGLLDSLPFLSSARTPRERKFFKR
jgi:GT2 family glycosyltransferase